MPNQINEDELQKAIDDITSSAQNGADADEPETPVDQPAQTPDFGVPPMPPMPPAPGAFDPATVAPLGDATPAPATVPMMDVPATPVTPEMPAPVEEATASSAPESSINTDAEQIRADILRELSPLMDKVQIEPERKFSIYRDMMMTNHDKSVISSAYETAKLISDEQKRGEALVSLIDAIDS